MFKMKIYTVKWINFLVSKGDFTFPLPRDFTGPILITYYKSRKPKHDISYVTCTLWGTYDTADPYLTWATLKRMRPHTRQATLLKNTPSEAIMSSGCDISHGAQRVKTSNTLCMITPNIWTGVLNIQGDKTIQQMERENPKILKQTGKGYNLEFKPKKISSSLEDHSITDNLEHNLWSWDRGRFLI